MVSLKPNQRCEMCPQKPRWLSLPWCLLRARPIVDILVHLRLILIHFYPIIWWWTKRIFFFFLSFLFFVIIHFRVIIIPDLSSHHPPKHVLLWSCNLTDEKKLSTLSSPFFHSFTSNVCLHFTIFFPIRR